MNRKLYRSKEDRVLAGVCGGFAEYFNVNPIIVRLGFAAFSLVFGGGIILYILAAILMPDEPVY